MLPTKEMSKGGPLAALALNAMADGRAHMTPARGRALEVCQHCGRLRPVFSTIPVPCPGQVPSIGQVPLCKRCTAEVSR